MMMGVTTEQFEAIAKHLLDAFPELVAVYAYGSVIRGECHQSSDLDLAILFPPGIGIDSRRVYRSLGELSILAGRSVDLGVLSLDNVVYAKEVVTGGRRIYCRDKRCCDEFELYALSFYATLNEERQEILQRYWGEANG